MKKLFLLFITIVSTNLTFSQTAKVVVSNSYEFIDALGSNKIIEIAADLNINDLDPNISGKHYKINTEWDAHTLVVFGLYNTEIIGQGATPKQITNSNVYSEVLQFENCTNIKIKNIEGGHGPRKGEACYGGVLTFINCQTVSVLNSIMYGSGSCGITAVDVKGLKCTKSVIHGCTQHGFLLRNSSNIEFDESDIFDNDFYTLFDINNCMNVTMNSCKIKNNHPSYLNDENELDPSCGTYGSFLLFDISESMSVSVKNCKIQNNFACFLMTKSNAAAFENTTLENNEFSFGNYFND
jgi:hypothetical protein